MHCTWHAFNGYGDLFFSSWHLPSLVLSFFFLNHYPYLISRYWQITTQYFPLFLSHINISWLILILHSSSSILVISKVLKVFFFFGCCHFRRHKGILVILGDFKALFRSFWRVWGYFQSLSNFEGIWVILKISSISNYVYECIIG